jgi:PAS domain S-box-containing protein
MGQQAKPTSNQMTMLLTPSLDLDQVLRQILDNIGHLIEHDGATIMLVRGDQAQMACSSGYYETGELLDRLPDLVMSINDASTLRQLTETRRPLIINDTRTYEGWLSFPETSWVRSYLGVAIALEDEVIGFLSLDSATPNAFAHIDPDQLMVMVRQMAIAIHNAQLYEKEQKRRQVAETLQSISAALNATLELDELLGQILDQLTRVIPCDSASVQQKRDNYLSALAVTGIDDPHVYKLKIPIIPDFPNYPVVTDKQPVAISDVRAAYPAFPVDDQNPGFLKIKSWLGVPLLYNQEVVGMITIDRWEIKPFTQDEIELATTFANHAATALNNAQLYQKLANYNQLLEHAVSERTKDLRHTMEQLQTILYNSPDVILLLDEQGHIQTINPTLTDLFGYRLDEIKRRPLALLAVDEDAASIERLLQRIQQRHQPERGEFMARRRDGATFDADIALAPVMQAEEIKGIVCSLRDISRFKEVERMKDAFISNVSHELRTPITSLKLNQDLIQRNPARTEVYVERMQRETTRLMHIVEDLLSLSRLEQGRVPLNKVACDFNRLALTFFEDRTPLAQENGLKLTLHQTTGLPLTLADDGLMGQVISILLTNAFNYTPVNGRITISTHQQTDDGENWVGLRVHNTGPAIPAEERPLLFERFYRGRLATNLGKPGTGLGLTIAKEIVERHDGRIEVISPDESGEGASFTVWLPVSP